MENVPPNAGITDDATVKVKETEEEQPPKQENAYTDIPGSKTTVSDGAPHEGCRKKSTTLVLDGEKGTSVNYENTATVANAGAVYTSPDGDERKDTVAGAGPAETANN